MEIKAIFMDMDGTMLKSDHKTISENLKNKLMELSNKGVKIFIATGRTFTSIKPYIEMLKITEPVITYNGAKIVDAKNGNIILEKPLNSEEIKKIVEFSRKEKIHLNLYINDKLTIENESIEGINYSKKAGIPYEVVNFDKVISSGDYSTKGLFLGEREKLNKLKENLEKEMPNLNFVFSQPTYLEILNKGANKGSAVLEILGKYNIKTSEAMAFGDQWNDYEMLKTVEHGYLMGNAEEKLKENFEKEKITLTNDEDGIYHIIKSL